MNYETFLNCNNAVPLKVQLWHYWLLTSPILLAEIGKPPDIPEPNAESENSEEKLNRAVPGDPIGALLHHVDLLLSSHVHLVHLVHLVVVPPLGLVTDWTLPCAPSALQLLLDRAQEISKSEFSPSIPKNCLRLVCSYTYFQKYT